MIKRDSSFAEQLLDEIINNLPAYDCNDFHHSKTDRHGAFETCNPMLRFDNAIQKARHYLASLDKP